ncbi:MAG: Glycosyl transferase group 1 [uncultured bacterium]|nr:MAG: Glycosyl transferase group 1 [uncultured bacterium]
MSVPKNHLKTKVLFILGGRASKILDPLKESKKIEPLVLPSETKIRLLNFLKLFIYSLKVRPALVLTDSLQFMAFESFLISKFLNIPFVIRLRGDPWQETKEDVIVRETKIKFIKKFKIYIKKILGNFSVKRADKIIVVSYFLKKLILKKINYPPDKITKIPLMFKPAQPKDISKFKKEIIITSVSNLVYYQKTLGLIKILPVMDQILSKYKKTRYLIAGGGTYLENLSREIKKMLNADRINLLGQTKNIQELYEKTDIFVHYSFFDAFPNVVLEAKSYGIPVIVNNLGGMVEQVNSQVDGFIINDEKELKEKLELLIVDEKLRKELGANGRNDIKNYSGKNITERFEEELLGQLNNG